MEFCEKKKQKHANAQQQVVLPFELPLKLRKPYTPYTTPGQWNFDWYSNYFRFSQLFRSIVQFSAANKINCHNVQSADRPCFEIQLQSKVLYIWKLHSVINYSNNVETGHQLLNDLVVHLAAAICFCSFKYTNKYKRYKLKDKHKICITRTTSINLHNCFRLMFSRL